MSKSSTTTHRLEPIHPGEVLMEDFKRDPALDEKFIHRQWMPVPHHTFRPIHS
jgi:plasmid maintenance system antidote protein VapI